MPPSFERPRWIFGYGSLVWRPAFAFAERRPAALSGRRRRFWQGSTDHRGLPGAPGRVVTLEPAPGELCWGTAYRPAEADLDSILAALDHREQGGYERCVERVQFQDGEGARALFYVALPDNPNFLGPAPLERIAAQVRASSGPSGDNLEYVLRLADALRAMGAEDEHVFALDALLRPAG